VQIASNGGLLRGMLTTISPESRYRSPSRCREITTLAAIPESR
jgi:hypothetical protein